MKKIIFDDGMDLVIVDDNSSIKVCVVNNTILLMVQTESIISCLAESHLYKSNEYAFTDPVCQFCEDIPENIIIYFCESFIIV